MSLARHVLRFRTERRQFEELIVDALGVRGSNPRRYRAIIERVVTALQDAWACRCRDIILHSAGGKTVTAAGSQLVRSPSLTGYKSAIDFLRDNWSPRQPMDTRWEPDWFVPQVSMRAANLLRLTNEAQITNGLGSSVVPDRLRVTRNVIVHSLPNTWQRFRSLSNSLTVSPMKMPWDFAVSYDAATGNRLIDDWLDEIETSLSIAVQ